MNQTQLIKKIWDKDLELNFSDKEIALYFFLVKTFSTQHSKNQFKLSNSIIMNKFGWRKETISQTRNKLQQAELINFIPGNGRGNTYTYEFVQKTTEKTNNKKTESKPHTFQTINISQKFDEAWNKLLKMPKWKNKTSISLQLTLNKLKEFDEDFAIRLIERCIIGNWQGIIFDNTSIAYKKWKTMQESKNEQPENIQAKQRKQEILRRAYLATTNNN